MSSTVAQLETASTRSPLRSDCTNTMPVAFATTSAPAGRAAPTGGSSRRDVRWPPECGRLPFLLRSAASWRRETLPGCGWWSGQVPVVDQSLDLPGRPGQRLGFHHHDLDAGADGVLDGLGHLGGGRVMAVAGAVRARLHLHREVVHAALGAEYELEVRGEPGRTQ